MTASPLTSREKTTALVAAFLAWMFAGLEISLFVLVHRQMTLELLGPGTPEGAVRQWFAWFQAAFLLGAAAGGWLFGWLDDRLGRSRALGLGVLCYSGFTLACYAVPTAELMVAVRFLACLGVGTGRVVAAAVVLSAGFLLDRFAGDYAAVGFWSGMVYAIGLVVIWFVPRRAGGRLED